MAKETDYPNIICPIDRKVWNGNFYYVNAYTRSRKHTHWMFSSFIVSFVPSTLITNFPRRRNIRAPLLAPYEGASYLIRRPCLQTTNSFPGTPLLQNKMSGQTGSLLSCSLWYNAIFFSLAIRHLKEANYLTCKETLAFCYVTISGLVHVFRLRTAS